MATPLDVRGRYFVTLIIKALNFYSRHRATLVVYLTPLVVQSVDALVVLIPVIQLVDPPGPE